MHYLNYKFLHCKPICNAVVGCLCFVVVALQVHLIVPSFIMSAGAVMFLDGIAIYNYHQDINLSCKDSRISSTDIHGDLNFIPVEFAGAVTSLMFYVSHSSSGHDCIASKCVAC